MFCEYCERITLKALIDAFQLFQINGGFSVGYPPPEPKEDGSLYLAHHPSFSSLLASAKAGCEFCLAIDAELATVSGRMDRILLSEGEGVDTRVRIAIGQAVHYGRWRIFDHIAVVVGFPVQTRAMYEEVYKTWFLEHEVGSFWIKFSLWRYPDASDTLSQFADGGVGWPYMGSSFACRETFDLARKWLKDCSEKCPNEDCLPILDQTLPTRVVDVGSSGMLEPPRLVLSHGKSGKYVALSHCWGGDITSKTTKAFVAQYTKVLPELPRSFRDAIKITRELGFCYLWIDSLCIIQDSVEDWELESAAMRDVYRNAAVTLAAAASKNSQGGILNLFGYDQPETKKWCNLRLYPSSLNCESVRLSSFYEKETFMECVDKLPLSHRGWTLQERLLSQRILHYGKDQIYFQCRTNHFNADSTPVQDSYSIHRQSSRALLNLSKPLVPNPFPSRRIETSGDWVNEAWRGVISAYSSTRELTKVSDKLPALSGIVSLFQAKTNDEYIVGLWKADLAHGLMWRLGDYSGPGPLEWKAFRDRALSWSWACWDGSVHFPFDAMKPIEDQYKIALLDSKIQYKGLNPFGEVNGGTLRLRCWTRPMTFKEITETIGTPALDRSRGSWDSQLEDEGQAAFLENDHIYTVVCVGTFQFGSPENTPKGYLLLDPVHEAGDAVFERVGIAPHVSWNFLDNFDPKDWKQMEISII